VGDLPGQEIRAKIGGIYAGLGALARCISASSHSSITYKPDRHCIVCVCFLLAAEARAAPSSTQSSSRVIDCRRVGQGCNYDALANRGVQL
jgi:hypothetical protein